nr:zinc finger, CCHC-type [Tanacetum cinerariifolium]
MHFLLSSMSVVYVLTTPIPKDSDDVEQLRKRAKWDNNDYVCRGLILNGMSDSLFDIYQSVESFKELWDSLDAKYMSEDASSKKFLVSNFTNYKMTDSRRVMEQYNELLGILGDFKHTLKHLKEELTLVELGSHLRIEESLRVQDSDKPKGNNVTGPSVVNMVEHNNSSMYNDNKGVNVGNKANGSSTKDSVDGSSNSLNGQNMFNKSLQVYYATYVFEAYFVKDDDVTWTLGGGEADVILGIRIKHESNGIAISLSHYIENVLKKFNYFDCTPVSTPVDISEKLMPYNGHVVSQLEYSRVIGCLMYAMPCTRPDTSFAVGKLDRYTSNPGTHRWQAIQRVLKYLKKTMNYILTYTGYLSVLEGYADASWISNTEDNSFISGWVFLLGSGAIS